MRRRPHSVKFTDEEWELIRAAAKLCHLSTSTWMRSIIIAVAIDELNRLPKEAEGGKK